MPAEERQRGSPEALLALAKKEARGHLKIFLGAAPGVGKTYAMLAAGRAEASGGRDVVIGLVETHGRAETEALVQGFEILPRKPIVYRNQVMKEFDLDAALVRRPSLLLVDEYAHTNVPGSRHPKRWQDIDELLGAGIDVWTTLNIQHLESLNDVIQKITKVRVRETVPDTVFDKADEIVLVDFPPDELLKRLAEGKVYVQDTAARAIESFFKPQNLTALRELALRRAAERIDADLVERMQAQAIEGPWAAGERILACIGPDPISPTVVRAAKRLADLMDAPWIAVTVERPAGHLDDVKRRRIDEAMALALSLGAETQTLVGNDIPEALLRFARFENVTQIVVGRPRERFFAELFRRSLPHELVRRAENIAVHILTETQEKSQGGGWRLSPRPNLGFDLLPILWSTLAVAASIGIGHALESLTTFPNVSMIFLMAVLLAAIRFGIWPAVYTSFISFLGYNFFFIDPRYTFTVAQPHEVFALGVFLLVAIMTSALAGRVREQAQVAASRMRAMRRLYEFTRRLSGLATLDDVAEGAASEIHASLGRATVVLLAQDGELSLSAAWPPEDALDTASVTAARWSFSHNEPAGADTGTLPTVGWFFIPLVTPRGPIGVIGVAKDGKGAPLDSEARALFDTLAEQTASALERASLTREMVSVRTAAETERVRNTLLASISHDFRTPLSSVLGAATSLLDFGEKLDADTRKDLLSQIKNEAEDLDEMVRNLLAITRIDAGALELHRDWIDLREIVGRVVSAAQRRGALQEFDVSQPNDLPLIRADATLVEQVMANVVGNAIAHTSKEAQITIHSDFNDKEITIHVTDDGPGISPGKLPRIFDKFVRGRPPETATADGGQGTGLGLAIAKGIMEAHGGRIGAQSPVMNGRGTRIILTFAREEAPA